MNFSRRLSPLTALFVSLFPLVANATDDATLQFLPTGGHLNAVVNIRSSSDQDVQVTRGTLLWNGDARDQVLVVARDYVFHVSSGEERHTIATYCLNHSRETPPVSHGPMFAIGRARGAPARLLDFHGRAAADDGSGQSDHREDLNESIWLSCDVQVGQRFPHGPYPGNGGQHWLTLANLRQTPVSRACGLEPSTFEPLRDLPRPRITTENVAGVRMVAIVPTGAYGIHNVFGGARPSSGTVANMTQLASRFGSVGGTTLLHEDSAGIAALELALRDRAVTSNSSSTVLVFGHSRQLPRQQERVLVLPNGDELTYTALADRCASAGVRCLVLSCDENSFGIQRPITFSEVAAMWTELASRAIPREPLPGGEQEPPRCASRPDDTALYNELRRIMSRNARVRFGRGLLLVTSAGVLVGVVVYLGADETPHQ